MRDILIDTPLFNINAPEPPENCFEVLWWYGLTDKYYEYRHKEMTHEEAWHLAVAQIQSSSKVRH